MLTWYRHPPYGGSSEDGGTERLETDVMRFMAILAFCLVAIFALVQSISISELGPVTQTQNERPQVETPIPPTAVVKTKPVDEPLPDTPVEKTRSNRSALARVKPKPVETQPLRPVTRPPPRTAVKNPAPQPLPDEPADPVTAPPAAVVVPRQMPAPALTQAVPPIPDPVTVPSEEQRGFTLRFESDEALTQLVRRGDINLYAFRGGDAWQLILVGGRATFRTSQEPRQFHEMTPSTVPQNVITTFRRTVVATSNLLKWGVTLPPDTSLQLTRLMAVNDGGELVIDARGQLQLKRW